MKYLLFSAIFISIVSCGSSEPKKVKVQDGDKDGIVDAQDKCIKTPAKTSVNKFGCIKGETITKKLNVLYPTGQTELSAEAAPHLAELGEYLKANPDATLKLDGFTDDTGSQERNVIVSAERVAYIKNYLVEREGVPSTQIIASSYGIERPVASNDTEEGKTLNRRVDGVIIQ